MDDPWGKQLSRSFDLSSQPLPSLTFTSLLSHLRLQSLGTQVWRQRVSAQPIVCLCCLMAAVIDSEEQSEPPANWSVAAAALFQVSPHIFSQFTSNKQSNALLLAVQIWGGGWPCIIWRMSAKYSALEGSTMCYQHFTLEKCMNMVFLLILNWYQPVASCYSELEQGFLCVKAMDHFGSDAHILLSCFVKEKSFVMLKGQFTPK